MFLLSPNSINTYSFFGTIPFCCFHLLLVFWFFSLTFWFVNIFKVGLPPLPRPTLAGGRGRKLIERLVFVRGPRPHCSAPFGGHYLILSATLWLLFSFLSQQQTQTMYTATPPTPRPKSNASVLYFRKRQRER